MEQDYCSAAQRKGKHMTREERVVIERMSRAGRPARDIAAVLGRHRRTVERELARGRVEHRDGELRTRKVYSSDRGQDVHELNATARGPQLKLGANRALAEFVRCRIVEHRESPDVVAFRMHQVGMEGAVCTKTIYGYIELGLIAGVSNETLWEKRRRRNRPRRVLRRRGGAGLARRESIEKRPEHVELRLEFGHWEMDLVVGPARSRAALLTLVERCTRQLIVRKLEGHTQTSVLAALKAIERQCGTRRFRTRFKSITVDNGSEFLDVRALSASAFSRLHRTCVFYAHPYAAWERGSNENANRMLRRFIAKGRDIARFSLKALRDIEEWINHYPRRLLDYKSPNQCFHAALAASAA